MKVMTLATTAALALAGAALFAAAPAIADVPTVHNTSPAEPDTARYTLDELWRIGGPDDEVILGHIGSAITDGDGRIYLLDSQLCQIQVYDADGEHLDTLGREGDGPGEFRSPGGLCWWEDGVIAVAGAKHGALELLTTDGETAGTVVLTNADGDRAMRGYYQCFPLGDDFLLAGNMGSGDGTILKLERFLCRHGRDGGERNMLRYYVAERSMNPYVLDEAKLISPWSSWVAHPDGRLYASMSSDAYRICAYGADGGEELIIEREYETLRRTDEEIEERLEKWLESTRRNISDAEVIVMDRHRDIMSIDAGPDGHLWVRTSRGENLVPEGALCVFDVFDTGGAWLRCVVLHDPHPDGFGKLDFLSGDLILRRVLLDEDDGVHGDDAPEETERGVICYRLRRVE